MEFCNSEKKLKKIVSEVSSAITGRPFFSDLVPMCADQGTYAGCYLSIEDFKVLIEELEVSKQLAVATQSITDPRYLEGKALLENPVRLPAWRRSVESLFLAPNYR